MSITRMTMTREPQLLVHNQANESHSRRSARRRPSPEVGGRRSARLRPGQADMELDPVEQVKQFEDAEAKRQQADMDQDEPNSAAADQADQNGKDSEGEDMDVDSEDEVGPHSLVLKASKSKEPETAGLRLRRPDEDPKGSEKGSTITSPSSN
jgi:hypothetical protein